MDHYNINKQKNTLQRITRLGITRQTAGGTVFFISIVEKDWIVPGTTFQAPPLDFKSTCSAEPEYGSPASGAQNG